MEIKFASILWGLLDALGLWAVVVGFINFEPVEQALLFVFTCVYFGYRIYHLHLDSEKKRIENDDRKFDLEQKKKPLRRRENENY